LLLEMILYTAVAIFFLLAVIYIKLAGHLGQLWQELHLLRSERGHLSPSLEQAQTPETDV